MNNNGNQSFKENHDNVDLFTLTCDAIHYHTIAGVSLFHKKF